MPAFITARVIAWIVAVLGLAGAVTAFAVHERSVEAAKIDAKVAETTAKLEKKNADALAKQHTADVAANKVIEDAYAKSLQLSNTTTAGLAQRLHDYEVASRRSVAVPGTPATPVSPDVPAVEPSRVDRAVEGVVRAAGQDSVKVQALQAYIVQECH